MSKVNQLINAVWDESNLVHSTDSTSEVVRKHKLFSEITFAISKGELQRGRDFGGTEEDSIYNDLNECDEMLCERAIMRHDREASRYIMEANKVEMMFWLEQQLSVVRAAYNALVEFEQDRTADELLDNARKLLKPLLPEPYPTNEDDSENED